MAKARKVLSVLIAAVLLLSAGGCTNLANVLEENTDLGEQSPTPSASPSAPVEPVYGGSISLAVYGLDTPDPVSYTHLDVYKRQHL